MNQLGRPSTRCYARQVLSASPALIGADMPRPKRAACSFQLRHWKARPTTFQHDALSNYYSTRSTVDSTPAHLNRTSSIYHTDGPPSRPAEARNNQLPIPSSATIADDGHTTALPPPPGHLLPGKSLLLLASQESRRIRHQSLRLARAHTIKGAAAQV